MKHKNKFLKTLSTMGFIFMIALGIMFFKALNNQGPKVSNVVELPRAFEREFSNVQTKRRLEPLAPIDFFGPDDSPKTWKDFQGEYLLINFWATWCPPCVIELPSLDKLAQHFDGKGLNVIAISIDSMRSHDDIKLFLKNRNIGEFAAYFDKNQDVQNKIYMRGIPTSILLDPEGNIINIFEGDAHWNSPSAIEFFEKVINS